MDPVSLAKAMHPFAAGVGDPARHGRTVNGGVPALRAAEVRYVPAAGAIFRTRLIVDGTRCCLVGSSMSGNPERAGSDDAPNRGRSVRSPSVGHRDTPPL